MKVICKNNNTSIDTYVPEFGELCKCMHGDSYVYKLGDGINTIHNLPIVISNADIKLDNYESANYLIK